MRTHHPGLIERGQRTGALSIGEYIGDIGDFTKPDPAIFCLDFVGCVLLTDILIYAADQSASFSLKQLLCILVGGLFLFRSSVFIHETVHAGKQIPFFGSLFNLLFGFVHKLPLYVMYPHKFHHTTETYGTIADPEYELLKGRPVDFVIPIFTQIISPLLLLMRFGFFPIFLPFLGKARRDTVYQYASTFVLNLKYVRARPDPSERREWYRQDAACVAYNCVFFALVATGIWPWKLFFIWYGVMYVSFVANFYRSMASHSYSSNMEPTSRKLQILDSTTFGDSWVMEWLYPVGLRYHALHHLFPHIPYHNLPKLHRLMLSRLPADHPYRETLAPNYIAASKRLVR